MKVFILALALLGSPAFASPPAKPICGSCHPKETAAYSKSVMGNSLIPPQSLPPGRVTHQASDTVITTEQRNGNMIHSIAERGLTAEYPIKYQIGGGLMGRTFMIERGNYLFESPVSWYNSSGWDLSPGYGHNPLIDFDRPMEEQCLFCHAGPIQFSDPDYRRLKNAQLTSITCERCHGESTAHVRHPSSENILNPAKLTAILRDSVCEQCHLEGANRTLNPGKNWDDFHPGEPTENIFATYVLTGGSTASVRAVSQVEQLAVSKCARGSAGKLWCATCHNPHGQSVNRQNEMRAICTSCHPALATSPHPNGGATVQAECTSCHMPRTPTTDIAHSSLSDHRILSTPQDASAGPGGPAKVTAWREPPADVRARDLAVAELVIGFAKRLPDVGQDAIHLLRELPPETQLQDATVVSDIEGLAVQQQQSQQAVKLGRHDVELQPSSAKAAMNFGIVLAKSGDGAEAELQFNRAIELDPSLKQAYMELAKLYASERKPHEVADTLDRFLKWEPQDIMFRLEKARLGTN
jgi:predicted CXXCH cytochrome family protein